jgi:hypothetical protein
MSVTAVKAKEHAIHLCETSHMPLQHTRRSICRPQQEVQDRWGEHEDVAADMMRPLDEVRLVPGVLQGL